MLKMEAQEAKGIAQAIIDLKDKTRFLQDMQ